MVILRKRNENLQDADDDIETYYNLIVKILSTGTIFIGVNGNQNLKKYGIFAKVPVLAIITIILSVYVEVIQMIYIFEMASSDILLATAISTNVFTNIACVSKGIRLSTKTKDFQEVLDDISAMWNAHLPKRELHEKIIKKAQKILFFVKAYTVTLVGAIFSSGVPPILNLTSQYLVRESTNHTYDFSTRLFQIKYYFPVNNWMTYLVVLCEEYWICFGLAGFWISSDALYASLTSHLALQFEILHHDIIVLVNNENSEKCLTQRFVHLIERHKNILRVCGKVNQLFGPVIFVNVLVASADICVNIYVTQKLIAVGRYADMWIYLSFALNIFLQIVIYCTFAENLTQKSLLISDALYNCNWIDRGPEFKKCLRIMFMRTQKPFYFSGYGFFTISHKKLMKIVNSSMSYFMMLTTTTQ